MQIELPKANAGAQALAIYNTTLKYPVDIYPWHYFFHPHPCCANTNS